MINLGEGIYSSHRDRKCGIVNRWTYTLTLKEIKIILNTNLCDIKRAYIRLDNPGVINSPKYNVNIPTYKICVYEVGCTWIFAGWMRRLAHMYHAHSWNVSFSQQNKADFFLLFKWLTKGGGSQSTVFCFMYVSYLRTVYWVDQFRWFFFKIERS